MKPRRGLWCLGNHRPLTSSPAAAASCRSVRVIAQRLQAQQDMELSEARRIGDSDSDEDAPPPAPPPQRVVNMEQRLDSQELSGESHVLRPPQWQGGFKRNVVTDDLAPGALPLQTGVCSCCWGFQVRG